MQRITSANGTSVAGADIMPTMRGFTTVSATTDSIDPFRVSKLTLICGAQATIKVNGENATALEENPVTGEYFINLGDYDVVVKTLVIVEDSIAWRATFLF